jgi:type IV secretion system protein TrbL
MKKKGWLILFFAYFVINSTVVFAGYDDDGQALLDIENDIINKLEFIELTVRGYSENLFYLLAAIEFIFTFIPLAFGAQFEQISGELVKKVIYIGFFSLLLTNGYEWAHYIWQSFGILAGQATNTTGTNVAEIFNLGLDTTASLAAKLSNWNVFANFVVGICAIGIVIMTTIMAALLLQITIEFHICASAGVILLGLGGSRWTSGYAVNYLKSAFAIGFKYFITLVFTTLVLNVLRKALDSPNFNSFSSIVTLFAIILLLTYLLMKVPAYAGALIQGSASSNDGMMLSSLMNTASNMSSAISKMGGGIANAGKATGGAAMAARQAYSQAATQVQSNSSSLGGMGLGMPSSRGQQMMQTAGLVLKNLLSGGKQEMGAAMTGQSSGRGTLGGRISNNMQNQQAMSQAGKQEGKLNNLQSGAGKRAQGQTSAIGNKTTPKDPHL